MSCSPAPSFLSVTTVYHQIGGKSIGKITK
nr:MAG TPA_asm: hypothetical protein [Caudoviricetes sp.]